MKLGMWELFSIEDEGDHLLLFLLYAWAFVPMLGASICGLRAERERGRIIMPVAKLFTSTRPNKHSQSRTPSIWVVVNPVYAWSVRFHPPHIYVQRVEEVLREAQLLPVATIFTTNTAHDFYSFFHCLPKSTRSGNL